jgi:hypothetical protein
MIKRKTIGGTTISVKVKEPKEPKGGVPDAGNDQTDGNESVVGNVSQTDD